RAKEHYRKALVEADPAARAADLGRTAEALGRWFEAEGWWSLAARRGGDAREAREALDRLAGKASPPPPPGKTLADLLPDLRPPDRPGRPRPEPSPTIPTFVDDAEAAGLRFAFDNG